MQQERVSCKWLGSAICVAPLNCSQCAVIFHSDQAAIKQPVLSRYAVVEMNQAPPRLNMDDSKRKIASHSTVLPSIPHSMISGFQGANASVVVHGESLILIISLPRLGYE